MAGGIKLAPLLTEIKVDIENFKSDMEKAAAIGTREAKRISQEMETTAKVGEKFSKAGDLLTKGLTLPIVGVGAAFSISLLKFSISTLISVKRGANFMPPAIFVSLLRIYGLRLHPPRSAAASTNFSKFLFRL